MQAREKEKEEAFVELGAESDLAVKGGFGDVAKHRLESNGN